MSLFDLLNGGRQDKILNLGLYVDTNMVNLVIVAYIHVESRYNCDCMGWTPDLYTNLTDTKRARYTHRVLFSMVSLSRNV